MSNRFTDENQLKAAMGITDWRNLSKEKLMNFVSILPDVDNEVAIKIIEQFPDFSKNSLIMVQHMQDICTSILEENRHSADQSIEAYRQILDELSLLLKRDDMSEDNMRYIADKMIAVADKISDKDSENKEFFKKLLNTVGGVALSALVIGAGVLGVKFLDGGKA